MDNENNENTSNEVEVFTTNGNGNNDSYESYNDVVSNENNNSENLNVEQNISSNSRKGSKEENKKFKQEKKKEKKKLSKRVIILIVVIAICILLTALIIFLKIMKLNKENAENNLKEDIDYVFEEETKKEAYDKDLTIKSLEETYDMNDLIIKTYKDVDGKVTDVTESYNSDIGSVNIEYVQINGLKNKDVENKINKEIKETVYSLYSGNGEHRYDISARVSANFSNILSIDIYKDESIKNSGTYEQVDYKKVGLNYDLNTGDKIALEDLFISSTPIASLIAKGTYEAMAWDTELNFSDIENFEKNRNMDNRDTSEYEEEILKVVNKYNSLKGNVNFCISSSRFCVTIYDLYNSSTSRMSPINIYFRDCKEYIAVFKKYVKGSKLYENNNIAMKNIFVLTYPLSEIMGDINYSIYGKVSDKVYVDIPINESVSVLDFNNQDSISDSVINKISKDMRDKLKRLVEDLKNEADNLNKGISYQAQINTGFERDEIVNSGVKKEPFIDITIYYSKVTMPLDYFKNNFLDLLAYLNYRPKASVSGLMLIKDDYDENLKIDGAIYDENLNKSYYYDLEGNYLGDDESALKDRVVENNETNNDNNYTNDYNNETSSGNNDENSNGNNDVDTDVNIYDDGSNETGETGGIS